MNGPDNYRKAQQFIDASKVSAELIRDNITTMGDAEVTMTLGAIQQMLLTAQVHAIQAQTAAMVDLALASKDGGIIQHYTQWHEATQ